MVTLRRLVWRESGIKNCRPEKMMMTTKKPFLEAQKANFDKSQNPNQSEFRQRAPQDEICKKIPEIPHEMKGNLVENGSENGLLSRRL